MTTSAFTPFRGSFGPLTRVTPFTHRDNATFLKILQEIVVYINETLRTETDAELAKVLAQLQETTENLITTLEAETAAMASDIATAKTELALEVEAAKNEWLTLFNDFMTEAIAGVAIETHIIEFLAGKVDKGSVSINVDDYDVISDASAATGVALQLAINASAALGVPLTLPKGRYLIDQVSIPSGLTIQGSGPETVIVQAQPAQPTLMSIGANTLLGSLTEDLAKGASTINVLQSWNLQPGDLIMVLNTASYAATDTAYKSGEQFRVKSSTGTTITLATPVRGSFTASGSYAVGDGAHIRKVEPIKNIAIRDVAFEGHAAGTATMLRFQCVDGLILDGISTIKAEAGFCTLDIVRNASITNWTLNGLKDNWSSGYPGYGFIVRHACHNIRISDGVSNMARHAITTIGGPYGIPRNLVLGPNIVSCDTSSVASIDTHAAVEGVLIHGNKIEYGLHGIQVRGRNVEVRGNSIRHTLNTGVITSEVAKDVIITGNRISNVTGQAVRIGAGGNITPSVTVTENIITDTTGDGISVTAGQYDIRLYRNTIARSTMRGIDCSAACNDIVISHNIIEDPSLGQNSPGINIQGTQLDGVFDVTNNVVREKLALSSRAIFTARTQGRFTGNRAYGPFTVPVGQEFSTPAGLTLGDNIAYL